MKCMLIDARALLLFTPEGRTLPNIEEPIGRALSLLVANKLLVDYTDEGLKMLIAERIRQIYDNEEEETPEALAEAVIDLIWRKP